jgi:hypothetical protein
MPPRRLRLGGRKFIEESHAARLRRPTRTGNLIFAAARPLTC